MEIEAFLKTVCFKTWAEQLVTSCCGITPLCQFVSKVSWKGVTVGKFPVLPLITCRSKILAPPSTANSGSQINLMS